MTMRNLAVLTTVALALLSTSYADAQNLGNGLSGYWPLDVNGADYSGKTRDLTILGGAAFGPGLFDQALSLTGQADQYASRQSDDGDFNFGSGDFTIQVWVNLNERVIQIFAEKFYGPTGPGWTFYDYADSLHFYADSTAVFLRGTPTISLGVWHQVVVRRAGTEFTMLFDAQVVANLTSTHAILPTSAPLILGQRNTFDGRNYDLHGSIDDVAIWNRALSDDDLHALYNAGLGRSLKSMLAKVLNATVSFPASVNPRSQGKTPVLILSTSTFDATTLVMDSVRFGATGTEASPILASIQDVNGDGINDLQLHFVTTATGIICGSSAATLTGLTASGDHVTGSGTLKTVGCK